MTIQIDRELFKERLNSTFGNRQHGDVACTEFSEEVFNLAQEWIDKEEWRTNPELDTARECRIEMKRHVKDNIDLSDKDKPWCITNFIWTWLAQQVIVFIVGLIIEFYWHDIKEKIETE
jgi:hypothetical protein|tara:strand:- start:340 stop:696 length:357 start_codon:yes stop_codon:yes gene_type:complete